MILQGPHQVAKKSTTMRPSAPRAASKSVLLWRGVSGAGAGARKGADLLFEVVDAHGADGGVKGAGCCCQGSEGGGETGTGSGEKGAAEGVHGRSGRREGERA